MKKQFFLTCIALLIAGRFFAQLPDGEWKNTCAFAGTFSFDSLVFQEPDERTQKALELLMKHVVLPANFELRAANVPNACAVLRWNESRRKFERYILYNPLFMRWVSDLTSSKLVALSILAHEAGHHLAGHTHDELGSLPQREEEADRFLGAVFFKMGSTLADAQAVLGRIAGDTATATHPGKLDRLRAIAEGWSTAQQQQGREVSTARPVRTAKPAMQPAHIHFSALSAKQISGDLKIEAKMDISDLRDADCLVTAWFFERGRPLHDYDQTYRTRSGNVATSMVVHPNRQDVKNQLVVLNIPIKELHLPAGRHHLTICLGVSVEGREIIGDNPRIEFVLQN